jgi:hypothetical protein
MQELLAFGQPPGSIIQIAYTVDDLAAAIAQWTRVMGVGPFFVFEHFPLIGHRYRGRPQPLDLDLALAYSGGMCVELIRQNDDGPSTYREVIARRGGHGFHHWGIGVRDFDAQADRLRAAGYVCASEAEIGGTGGARGAYFDTTADLPGMVELIEMNGTIEGMFDRLRAAAAAWDGDDPIRRVAVSPPAV